MITKRQLGIFVLVVAFVVAAGSIGVDLVGAGEWSGFGPLQQLGLAAGFVLAVVGFFLVRLGDRPA
jgi:hypothetical protein